MYPSLPKTMSKEPVLTYSHAKHEHFSDMILFTLAQGNADSLKCIRKKLYEPDFSDLTVIDFTTLAQGCKAYDEFIGKIKDVAETNLTYHGIAICTPTLSLTEDNGKGFYLENFHCQSKSCRIPHHYAYLSRQFDYVLVTDGRKHLRETEKQIHWLHLFLAISYMKLLVIYEATANLSIRQLFITRRKITCQQN